MLVLLFVKTVHFTPYLLQLGQGAVQIIRFLLLTAVIERICEINIAATSVESA
jgi:hypothetical protein